MTKTEMQTVLDALKFADNRIAPHHANEGDAALYSMCVAMQERGMRPKATGVLQ